MTNPTVPQDILVIDPGLTGGWATVNPQGKLTGCGNFPTCIVKKSNKNSTQLDGPALASLIKKSKASRAYVELVGSRPRQAGQFQFGINTGMLHGMLHAYGIPFTLVTSMAWKASYGIKRIDDETKRDKKTEARVIAAGLWPEEKKSFARVKDDGVAEAALIALHGLWLQAGFKQGTKDD